MTEPQSAFARVFGAFALALGPRRYQLEAALGAAEQALLLWPEDPDLRACKGALLVLMSRHAQGRQAEIYARSGRAICAEAMAAAQDRGSTGAEQLFCAMIAAPEPRGLALKLMAHPGFADLSAGLRARVCAAAALAPDGSG